MSYCKTLFHFQHRSVIISALKNMTVYSRGKSIVIFNYVQMIAIRHSTHKIPTVACEYRTTYDRILADAEWLNCQNRK